MRQRRVSLGRLRASGLPSMLSGRRSPRRTWYLALVVFVMLLVSACDDASTRATVHGQAPATPQGSAAKELTLDLGDKVTLKLVLIPPGKFVMGSPPTEWDRQMGEVQHEVTISKPFYMGITHATVDQFAAFVKESGYKTDAEKDGYSYTEQIKDGTFDFVKADGLSWRNPAFQQKGDHPVVQVSWNDAQAFCGWLSKRSGKTVALPTEAQWEYASRAGAKTAFPWGDHPDDGKGWANCADQALKAKLPKWNSDYFTWDDGFVYTSPVGSFKPNVFGLYDMIGNAWQWCQDRFGDYDKVAVTDPTGTNTGNYRVLRGGCWHCSPHDCRVAYRDARNTNYRHDGDGFRVVVALPVGE